MEKIYKTVAEELKIPVDKVENTIFYKRLNI